MGSDHMFRAVSHVFSHYFEVQPAAVRPQQELKLHWGLEHIELQWLARLIEAYTDTPLDDYTVLAELRTVDELAQLFRAQAAQSHTAARPN